MPLFMTNLENQLGGAVAVTPEAEDAALALRYLNDAGAHDIAAILGLT